MNNLEQIGILCRNLRANNILGTIPRELGQLKNLQNLDLALNWLSGAIPNEIGNLSNIAIM